MWSKSDGLENDDRLPLRNALVDLVRDLESMAMWPTVRGGPHASCANCTTPTREPTGVSAATCMLDIEGEGAAPHLKAAGMLVGWAW